MPTSINGNYVSSSNSDLHYDGTQFLRLSRWGGGGRYWNGEMDELRLYDTVLTEAQIKETMYTAVATNTSHLQAYYKMNESAGNILHDATNQKHDGTLIGNPTFGPSGVPYNYYYSSFRWSPGGETTSSIKVADIGSYSVMVTDTNGCQGVSAGIEVKQGYDSATFYQDKDGDGYGNAGVSLYASVCNPPTGYVYDSTDCNDANGSIYPGADEIINGIDDNCNGIIDDIRSDLSWVYSNNLESGWEQASFNDAGWKPVIVLGTGGFGDPNVSLIWGDHPGSSNSVVYMRKTFVLGANIPKMALDHSEDDDADVYVNGKLVSSDHNTVAGPDIFNVYITPYLVANDTNVIAVKATDTYCCGYAFYLRTHTPVCPTPAKLRVPKIYDTCARLNWNVPDSSVEHIKVSYRRLGDTIWIHDRKKSLENSKWVCGLTPNTTYEWKVRNICADDKTEWVHGPNFTTAASFAFSSTASAITGSQLPGNIAMQIMPNPSNGNFNIQLQLPDKAATTSIALYNNMGAKVWQQDAGKISGAVYKNISLQNQLPAGIYMMVIQRNDVRLVQKIVINK